mmetsp:Transcript_12350/g.37838  ORF Transcript_12350/g.37838 Transcript_12350/m.37838 type:complete len:122 (-) Transcript_12350:774-1139(-)
MLARAALCYLPLAASLRVPHGSSPQGAAARTVASPSAYAEPAAGPACFLLNESQAMSASKPFAPAGMAGEWYACTGPADDQELTCFLAPAWMGLPEGQWVCSTDHSVGHPEQGDLSADDSY